MLINSGLVSCIKDSLHIKCRGNVWGPRDGPQRRLRYGGRKRKHVSEFRCLGAVQSQPCLFFLWLCGGSSSRLAASRVHVDLRNSRRPHLCVVLSPLWGALHYFPTATSEYPHIPLTFLPGLPRTEALYHNPPPPHIFFPLTICLNDSITLTSKVWSICLRMQEVMLSCFYIEFGHIFHIRAFYHPLMQLLALAKRQLLSAHPSYEAKESIHPRWQKNKGNIFCIII